MAESLRRISGFSPETLNQLRNEFYVYALIDPRRAAGDPRRYFYVGKGQYNRCFAHANEELKQKSGELSLKHQTIRAIREATGFAPPVEILHAGLSSAEAFQLESILIKLLKTEGNAVLGQRSRDYCVTAEAYDAMHSRPLTLADINACVLLVNLNGGSGSPAWPEISPEHLDSRVLGDWPVSAQRASCVEYVVGVWAQVVRCVYKTAAPPDRYTRFTQVSAKGRQVYKVRFSGSRDEEMEQLWCDRSIIEMVDGAPKIRTKFPPQRGSVFLAPNLDASVQGEV